MTAPGALTQSQRIDVLLDRIDELEQQLAGAAHDLLSEQEAHRLTREGYEAFAQRTGIVVTERGEAEEIVQVTRQFLESFKDTDTKNRILEVVRALREGLREPLPRERRDRKRWAAD